MRLEIDIAEHHYNNIMALDSVSLGRVPYKGIIMYSINAIKHGKVLDQEPTTKNNLAGDIMEFPKTFDEFANLYGFKDKDEIYTNGSELIPVFRVKQWLEHISTTKNNLGVEEVTALAEWTEKLTKASEDAYNKGYADGVKSVNICPNCGEYIGEEE